MGIITVEDFEKAVKTFGFKSPVITAIWNAMYFNEDNQKEFEEVYTRWSIGKYKEYDKPQLYF